MTSTASWQGTAVECLQVGYLATVRLKAVPVGRAQKQNGAFDMELI